MILVQAFLRGAIVFLISALITLAMSRRSAAVRHHIWASALVVQLAILAFIPVLPTFALPIAPTIDAYINDDVASPTPVSTSNTTVTSMTAEQSAPVRTTDRPRKAPIDWKKTFFYIWVTGAAFVFLRYLIGTLIMTRIARRGIRVEDGDWLTLAQRIARQLDVTRPVTLLWGDKLAVPITWGVLYPMILLPASASEWSEERRRFVLVHEMAHVKRFDALTQLVAQVTLALFWFSPFVWLSEWRLRVEREHACDDVVLHHGTEPTLYADELLQMVRSLVSRRSAQPAFAALAMARRSEFEGRMLAILDPARSRRAATVTSSLAFVALALVVAAPLAAVDPFAVNVRTIPVAPTSPKVSNVVPPRKPEAPQLQASALKCEYAKKDNELLSLHSHADDNPDLNETEVQIQSDKRCLGIGVYGRVMFAEDDQSVHEMGRDAKVVVRERRPGLDFVAHIAPNEAGALTTSYYVDGKASADLGRGQAWIARVLPTLLREAGQNADVRVKTLLSAHGLQGTLESIASISSTSSRATHYVALIKARDWNATQLDQIARDATASLGKSSDLPRVLNSMPKQAKTGEGEWLEKALSSITSSSDLSTTLMTHLPNANKKKLLMLMRVSRNITSSNDKSNFLTVAEPYALTSRDAELEEAWFAATATIESSYNRSNALLTAIQYAYGNERVRDRIGEAALKLGDYEKANVITALSQVR